MLDEELFFQSIGNTLILVAGIVPLSIGASLFLAILTETGIRGTSFYKTALFPPMVTSSVAIALVWYWLYAPDFGLINSILSIVGVQGPGWMADPTWAKPAVIVMISWQSIGFFYLIFLAGLKHIPREYYEAAEIDGANDLKKFIYITLPLLSPTTFFILITTLIGVFNIFSEVFMMTRGGPVNSTYTLVMHIYYLAFRFFRMGEAAVVSWVLFIILMLLTFVQFRFSRRWVHYGS